VVVLLGGGAFLPVVVVLAPGVFWLNKLQY
jgi:hypothetical protein